MIGNAHLDPAWMWRIGEGMEAFIATCRSALERIAETDQFIFTCSSAAHLDYVSKVEPELFARIKLAVKSGKWSLVGGWWVEADCNLPSGEGFVRQALYGQRFFLKEFGETCNVGYCIDSFGHHANLPQLLKKAGMESYVFMRPQEEELHLEDPLFWWQGPSGDRVLSYRIPLHYSNHALSSIEKIEQLQARNDFGKHDWMLFYGVGNHGGGPTKKEIAAIGSEAVQHPEIKFSSPAKYFDQVRDRVENVVTAELQFHAVGCYSAHSEIKRLNRKAEHALTVAERLGVLAEIRTGQPTDHHGLTLAWKNVCFNHFHDLLGGVATREALDDAISMYREALSIAEREKRLAVQRIASRFNTKIDDSYRESVLVLNPTANQRTELVEFELWHPDASERGEHLHSLKLRSQTGESIFAQRIESDTKIGGDRVRFLFEATVAPFETAAYQIAEKVNEKAKPKVLEIPRSFSNLAERSFISVVEDESDTWAHGVQSFAKLVDVLEFDVEEINEVGPLRGCLRRKSNFHSSSVLEEWRWTKDNSEIDVRLRVNWNEKRRILRLSIPHSCVKPRAFYEIPYSVIERPISDHEMPGQSWVFVQEGDEKSRGIGVITDSKYSYSVDNKNLNIIIARSPIFAHHVPPEDVYPIGPQLYQDQGEQEIRLKIVLGKTWRETNMAQQAQDLLEPLIVHVESAHLGDQEIDLPTTVTPENILLTVLKQAEDHDGWIVRLCETSGVACKAKVNIGLLNASWNASFGPFEIKTFHVKKQSDKPTSVREVDLIELPIGS